MKKVCWLLLVFTVGCGGSGDGSDGGDNDGGDVGPIEYPNLDCDPLVPEFCGFPFPSNVYTVEDSDTSTGRRVSFGTNLLRKNDPEPWDQSDGFSAGTPILTYLPGATGAEFPVPLDVAPSLEEDSPTIVIDAETGDRIPHFAEIDVRGDDPAQRAIHIRPVVRLQDATRYIVALRGLRDEADALIEPSPAFAALRDGDESNDPSVDAREGLYKDIFQRLSDAGVDKNNLQLAWDFTTASDANNTAWLLHMRDEALDLAPEEWEAFLASLHAHGEVLQELPVQIVPDARAPAHLLIEFGDRRPQMFRDVLGRDLDQRHAAVEQHLGGDYVLPQVELTRRRPILRRPAQPHHHDLVLDLRLHQDRRRNVTGQPTVKT